MSPDARERPGWGKRLRDEPGRSVIDLIGGILAAALTYVAVAVATLSWCIPDSCERSVTGIVGGTLLIALGATVTLRWLSLRLLTWQRATTVAALTALVLTTYEAIDKLVL